MFFKNRAHAGQQLAEKLNPYKNKATIVLALPRGGVPVAYEIAEKLNTSLDVLVAHKLGAPFQKELGIGAIAPQNIKVLDKPTIASLNIDSTEIAKVEAKERRELARRQRLYRGHNPFPQLKNQIVILVDDGIATGVTIKAAMRFILAEEPLQLIVAVPVCPVEVKTDIQKKHLRLSTDKIICLQTPPNFAAVGMWYQNFDQVSDHQVLDLLKSLDSKQSYKQPINSSNTSPNP